MNVVRGSSTSAKTLPPSAALRHAKARSIARYRHFMGTDGATRCHPPFPVPVPYPAIKYLMWGIPLGE